MILPPPRGDPSHLPHQSSSRLRRPERPRQKARYAPSRAAILAESVARFVHTSLGSRPISVLTLLAFLEMRRAAKRGGSVRDMHPPASSVPWLWPETPRMAQGMCALRVLHFPGISPCNFPTLLFNRKTIMSPCSVRRSRISWRRRE